MKITNFINDYLNKTFKVTVIRNFPRYSTRKVKELFGNKPIKVVEIGTYKGDNAKDVYDNLNVSEMFLIDPYKVYDGLNTHNCSTNESEIKEDLKQAYRTAKKKLNKENITFIKRLSIVTFNLIPDDIDFIYIDGNHDYHYVAADIELYYDRVKEGGVIAGHDISYISVMKAVSEFVVKNKLDCEVRGNDWLIVKPYNKMKGDGN